MARAVARERVARASIIVRQDGVQHVVAAIRNDGVPAGTLGQFVAPLDPIEAHTSVTNCVTATSL
jgi:hypothetical protein